MCSLFCRLHHPIPTWQVSYSPVSLRLSWNLSPGDFYPLAAVPSLKTIEQSCLFHTMEIVRQTSHHSSPLTAHPQRWLNEHTDCVHYHHKPAWKPYLKVHLCMYNGKWIVGDVYEGIFYRHVWFHRPSLGGLTETSSCKKYLILYPNTFLLPL